MLCIKRKILSKKADFKKGLKQHLKSVGQGGAKRVRVQGRRTGGEDLSGVLAKLELSLNAKAESAQGSPDKKDATDVDLESLLCPYRYLYPCLPPIL